MKSLIKRNRAQIEIDLQNTDRWRLFTPAIYAQFKVLVPILIEHASGNLLDMGCGTMPYKRFLTSRITLYDGVDLYSRDNLVTFVADIQDMPIVQTNTYDVVIAIEALEHIPNPTKAILEAKRVLKPRGKLIISVPHLSRLHDEPHDYFRFTKYGLSYMLEQAGFEVILARPKGGLFSFIGHQVSTIVIGLVWNIPIVKEIAFFLNSLFCTRFLYWLDSVLDKTGLIPLGYVVVAKRP